MERELVKYFGLPKQPRGLLVNRKCKWSELRRWYFRDEYFSSLRWVKPQGLLEGLAGEALACLSKAGQGAKDWEDFRLRRRDFLIGLINTTMACI